MMDVTERITLLMGHCREALYPEALLDALSSYLSGEGSLTQVQQEWAALPLKDPAFPPSFGTLFETDADTLDELDQRCLNICLATNHLDTILDDLEDDAPIGPLFRYLQQHPEETPEILNYLIGCYDWMRNDQPSPFGRLLLYYLPEHLPAMLPLMTQNHWDSEYEEFLELLATAKPQYNDAA